MNAPDAKRLVVVSTVATGTLTVIALYRRGTTPTARVGVGVIGAGVILATIAEVAPNLAAAFAVLMLATSAFVAGGDAWEGLQTATKPQGQTA